MSYLCKTSEAVGGILSLTVQLSSDTLIVTDPGFSDALGAFIQQLKESETTTGGIINLEMLSSAGMPGCRELLKELTSEHEDVAALSQYLGRFSAQLRALESCAKPVVALIHAGAQGAILEMALACHYRIASNHNDASFGFSHVEIGLMPGAGGSQRLPRLLGIQSSVDMLLKGKTINARDANAKGLIDELVEPVELTRAALAWFSSQPKALQPWDRKGYRMPGGAGQQSAALSQYFMTLHGSLLNTYQDNYPAPRSLLCAVYEGSLLPLDAALRVENRYLTELFLNPVACNMLRTLKIGKSAADGLLARPQGVAQSEFNKIGILGAGMMGAGIAYCSAAAGLEVVLLDRSMEFAKKGKDYSRSIVARHVSRRRMNESDAGSLLDRIIPTTDYAGLEGCDLVIEAVFENLDIKAEVTRKAEAVIPKSAVFATNTSTLRITKLAEASSRPRQFIGLHFSSPVDRMPIIEVIPGEKTSQEALAKSLDFASVIAKTPIVVNDNWGFYLSRVFGTYPEHGGVMLSRGVAPALIENAGRQAGMPIGPLAIIDEISLDLSKSIQDAQEAIAGDEFKPSKVRSIAELFVTKLGRLGRKSGGGFYEYPANGEKYLWPGLSDHFPLLEEQPGVEEIKKSLLYRQALEAVRCLEEGVITSVADADVCAVVGWNFPAYTGGPLSLIDTVGLKAFIADCRHLAEVYGDQFLPSQLLIDMQMEGKHFYHRG